MVFIRIFLLAVGEYDVEHAERRGGHRLACDAIPYVLHLAREPADEMFALMVVNVGGTSYRSFTSRVQYLTLTVFLRHHQNESMG
jgi:hypothetical protein